MSVKKVRFRSSGGRKSEILNECGVPIASVMIDELVKNEKRNTFILNILQYSLRQQKRVLLLSHRLAHIDLFYKLMDSEFVGKYIAAMSHTELNASRTKQIVLATYVMASEGFGIRGFDIIVLATPRKNVEQFLGRVPLIIDIADEDNSFFWRLSKYREQLYLEQLCDLQYFVADHPRQGYKIYNDLKMVEDLIDN